MDLRLAAYFLVILNPFSQVLFLWELMRTMTWRDFMAVYGRASLLSFGVYALFALTGDYIFVEVFQVRTDAFRIFGGLIVFIISLRYFTQGGGAAQFFRGEATELATSISIPFMVGPATIWVSILIGRSMPTGFGVLLIAAVLAVNFMIVCLAQGILSKVGENRESLLGAYFTILMRTNALFIGAIGIEMILAGLEGVGLPATAGPDLTTP
jgi:multiple antibiotic resistance protein